MDIRKLSAKDWAEYKKFRILSLEESPQFFQNGVNDELSLPNEVWKSRVNHSKNGYIIGAFVNSKLVGTAGFTREQKEKICHKSFVWGVYVDSEHRGKGVATKLLELIVREFNHTNGINVIQLTVSSKNREAISLYEKAGFEKYGIELDAIRVNGISYDEILMCYVKVDLGVCQRSCPI